MYTLKQPLLQELAHSAREGRSCRCGFCGYQEEVDCLLPETSGVSSSLSWLESTAGSAEAEWALGQGWQLAFQVRLLPRTLVVSLAALQ